MSMPFSHRRPKLNAVASLTILLSCSAAQAEIDYHVKVKPEDKKIEVEIIVPTKGPETAIQIPNWSPGAYSYGNFYESVHDVGAMDSKGTPVPINHPDKNTWTVASQTPRPITFKYWVPIGGRRAFLPASEEQFRPNLRSVHLHVRRWSQTREL